MSTHGLSDNQMICYQRVTADPAAVNFLGPSLDDGVRVAEAYVMKVRVAALVALLVVIAVVVAIGGWWYVKDRQRIGQASLQSAVASKSGATAAICEKKDSNAAHWLCVVTASGAPPRCMRAHVRPWGSVDVVSGFRKCVEDPQLAPLMAKPASKQGA